MNNPMYKSYKKRAEKTNKIFSLSEDKFDNITKSKCLYCGIEYDKIYKNSNFNGIDRVLNEEGYVDDNCVASCWICNRAKSNLTVSEFTEWMKRFVNFNKYRFDENISISGKWKIELGNRIEAGASDIKNYEEDCLIRFIENTIKSTNIPRSILLKIFKKAKQNNDIKNLVIRWMYGLDKVLNTEITNAYFSVVKKPSIISELDNQINPAILHALLHSVKLDKKEFRALQDVRIYSTKLKN